MEDHFGHPLQSEVSEEASALAAAESVASTLHEDAQHQQQSQDATQIHNIAAPNLDPQQQLNVSIDPSLAKQSQEELQQVLADAAIPSVAAPSLPQTIPQPDSHPCLPSTLDATEAAQVADLTVGDADTSNQIPISHVVQTTDGVQGQVEQGTEDMVQTPCETINQVTGGGVVQFTHDVAQTTAGVVGDAVVAAVEVVRMSENEEKTTIEVDPKEEENRWHSFFILLQNHLANHGTIDIEYGKNPPLEEWVQHQRDQYKLLAAGEESSLTKERCALLEAIKFDWTLDTTDTTWKSGFDELVTFKEQHGHMNVSAEANPSLNQWVMQQLDLYQNDKLPRSKFGYLDSLGFNFEPDDQVAFETRLNQLKTYKEQIGDLKVPYQFTFDNTEAIGLGKWLSSIKKYYQIKCGSGEKVIDERSKLLVDIGVDLSAPTEAGTPETDNIADIEEGSTEKSLLAKEENDESSRANRIDKWCEKYEELRAYKLINGHTNVPRRSKRNPANDALGEWVHFQRRQYRNLMSGKTSTMTVVRKKALEQLGFQWSRTGVLAKKILMSPLDDQVDWKSLFGKDLCWETRFGQLQDFRSRFGHINVESGWAENPMLPIWMEKQREENLKPYKKEDSDDKTGEEAKLLAPVSDDIESDKATLGTLNKELGVTNDDKMTQERFDLLVSIGFDFKISVSSSSKAEDTKMEQVVPDSERVLVEDSEDTMFVVIGEEDFAAPLSSAKDLELDDSDVNALLKAVPFSGDTNDKNIDNAMAASSVEQHVSMQGEEIKQSDEHVITSESSAAQIQEAIPSDSRESSALVCNEVVETEVKNITDPTIDTASSHAPETNNSNGTEDHKVKTEGNDMNSTDQNTRLSLEDGYNRVLQHVQAKKQPETTEKKRQTILVRVAWEERYLELVQFKLRKDSCNVPRKWKPNPSLADWVRRQRNNYILYKNNQPSTLNSTRIAKLNEIGFDFYYVDDQMMIEDEKSELTASGSESLKKVPMKKRAMKPNPKGRYKEGKWLLSLGKVIQYKEIHGNCNVPRKWKDDPTLGEWVHFQRRQYRNRMLGKRNHMTDERIARLQEIGFEWSRGHSSNPQAYLRVQNQNEANDVEMNEPSDLQMDESSNVPMIDQHTGVTSNEEEMKIEQIVEEEVQQFSCASSNQTTHTV